MRKLFTAVAALTLLSSCSGMDVKSYEAKAGPKLDIRQYLSGNLEAWGTIIHNDGSADPQFFVTLKGVWHGNTGTLDEDFTYVDGTKKHRLWHLTMIDDHHFTGTAADVDGTGVGAQFGNAANMTYVIEVPHDGGTVALDADDWLYRIDATHVINHTELRKYGVKVGEIVIGFRKL